MALKDYQERGAAKKAESANRTANRKSPDDKKGPDYSKTSPKKDTSKDAGNKVPGKRAVTSGKKEVGMGSKKSKSAFESAFAKARKSGAKEFTYNGKKYNTKIKGE